MSFELHISCSKDIDFLKINFSDCTTVVNEVQTPRIPNKKTVPNSRIKNEQLLDTDTDTDWGELNQEVIKLPDIQQNKRKPNVAHELQNLDI